MRIIPKGSYLCPHLDSEDYVYLSTGNKENEECRQFKANIFFFRRIQWLVETEQFGRVLLTVHDRQCTVKWLSLQ